jgi:hypothetical protein
VNLERKLMSHIVQITTQVKDAVAVQAACERLGLPLPSQGTFRLFSGEATGLGVNLPRWRYPAVCDLQTGQVRYDHFNGRWGDPQRLADFLQAYAAEKVKIESRRQGHSVTEQPLEDGSIKLTVHVGDEN